MAFERVAFPVGGIQLSLSTPPNYPHGDNFVRFSPSRMHEADAKGIAESCLTENLTTERIIPNVLTAGRNTGNLSIGGEVFPFFV